MLNKSIDMIDQRIKVSLKTLVSLVALAGNIKLKKAAIKANQSGGYISNFKGRGMEFDETRLYQAGDDIRSIDWRVTARTNKTYTKLFREERERPVFISVDYRASMHFATRGVFKTVQAAKLAALLAWSGQRHGDRIGGQVFSDHTSLELKPVNGKHGVLLLLHELVAGQNPDTAKSMNLSTAMARLSRHVRPGSLVYIISDFRKLDANAERYLSKLAHHCDVVLINIFDPLESQLPNKGRYRFTDEHSNITVDTADRQRVTRYHERFQHHQQHLKSLAQQLRTGIIHCSTNDDIVEVLRNLKT